MVDFTGKDIMIVVDWLAVTLLMLARRRDAERRVQKKRCMYSDTLRFMCVFLVMLADSCIIWLLFYHFDPGSSQQLLDELS